MGRTKNNLHHSYLLKINDEDRSKLTILINEGINMSYEFRQCIRKTFKDYYESNKEKL